MIVPSFQSLGFDWLGLSYFLRALEFENPLTAINMANVNMHYALPSGKFNITDSFASL